MCFLLLKSESRKVIPNGSKILSSPKIQWLSKPGKTSNGEDNQDVITDWGKHLMPDAWWPELTSVQTEYTCLDLKLRRGVGEFGTQERKDPPFLQTKEMKEFRFGVDVRSNKESDPVSWG